MLSPRLPRAHSLNHASKSSKYKYTIFYMQIHDLYTCIKFPHIHQCCVTRVGTRTRVHFTRTLTRVQFFSPRLRNRDSGSSHARVQAVAAVPCCAVSSDIRYILLFVFMFWKINKCWICGLLDSWLGLADSELDSDSDSDSDSDFEVMTRTRTQRWWLGLGLRGDDSDSDLTTWTRTQHWYSLLVCLFP